MLCDNGTANGHRVLSRKMVDLMMANNLYDLPLKYNTIRPNNHADGFGFGGEVRIEQGGDRLGSLGDFGWDGLATRFCKINRSEGIVALCLTQHLPSVRDSSKSQIKSVSPSLPLLICCLCPNRELDKSHSRPSAD